MIRFGQLISSVVIFVSFIPLVATSAEPVLGLKSEQPSSGRFVKTEQGYMVPYEVTIPGTEIQFLMQPVPGGKFKLGSPEDEEGRGDDEGPQVEVEVAPFWMGQHEVTWGEYHTFMGMYMPLKSLQGWRSYWQSNATKPDVVAKQELLQRFVPDKPLLKAYLDAKVEPVDAITVPTPLYDPDITYESGKDPQQPAVTMSQYAAKHYTKWLSGILGLDHRLPTEAEWEYAARAGSSGPYSFGDDPEQLEEYAWFADNSDATTHKVGQKKPNAWQLFDMHGNVAEWVVDSYSESGYDHIEEDTTVAAKDAIRWPTKLFPRVLRGGFWDDDAEQIRSAARLASNDEEWYDTDPNFPKSPWWFTDYPAGGVGFRVVRPLQPLDAEAKKQFWEADVERLQGDIANRLEEGRGVQENVDGQLPQTLQDVLDVEEKMKDAAN